MAKERKRAREQSDESTSEDRLHEDVKRTKLGSPSETVSADEYIFWLVRKPTRISLDKLSDLKFPTKAERHVETLSSQESNGVSLQCQFEPARTQLLHVPMNIVTSQKDALRLKAANELCGTVFITERITTADEARVDFGTGTAGMTPEADNGHGEDATDTFNFEIHSIRKKPTLPIEGVRERVKAFGVSRKKKRDKLPNLITSK